MGVVQKCSSCQKEYEAPKGIELCKTCTGVMWIDFITNPDSFSNTKYGLKE